MRQQSRLNEAIRFRNEFTQALAAYLEVEPTTIHFLKREEITVNTHTGEIIPDEIPFEFDSLPLLFESSCL